MKNCEDLGRQRMKTQKASGDLQEGGIMFPSSKTNYLKMNT